MNSKSLAFFAVAALAVAGVAYYTSKPADVPAPVAPAPPPKVDPVKPKKPKGPWGPEPCAARVAGIRWRDQGPLNFGASVGGPVGPGNTEINCDYPGERHVRNTSSHGLGLCVFTSIHHAADWQNIPQLVDMPKWMVKSSIPGGGYPEKVKTLITRISKERGMQEPEYFQVERADPAVLKAASASGKMICCTYSRSPTGRYGGGHISHMVNMPHADDAGVAVLDNNYIGYNAFEWMTWDEARKAGCLDWVVIFSNPGPPPAPHNGTPAPRTPANPQSKPRCERCGNDCQCEDCVCDRAGWFRWNVGDDAIWSLYIDGKEVGYYNAPKDQYFRKLSAGSYEGTPSKCPTYTPYTKDARERGVDHSKLSATPRYWHGNVEVDKANFELATAGVPDDVGKYRVVAVGPKDVVDKLRAEWASYPQEIRDAYILQAYEPTHWHVAAPAVGYVLDKSPAIHVVKPDGLLIEYQEGYSKDKLVSALRRKAPNFKPTTPAPGLPSDLPIIPVAVVTALGVAGYVVLKRKK